MIPLPEKYFYTIGDVSRATKVKPHVLRYWESQFKILRPARRYSGHRKYTEREIDLINKIRYLVVERRFTITGAKREIHRQLLSKPKSAEVQAIQAIPPAAMPFLSEIKKEVEECLKILEHKGVQPELGLN